MTERVKLRETYIQGWYQMDAEMLLAATAEDFIFDDPAEPEPVTRQMLPRYMQRWDQRTRALGANNQWIITNNLRQDKDGMLMDWLWWEVVDTRLQGAAVVLTGNNGVVLERIAYFDRSLN
jgi:hypothetical protein